MMTHVKRGDISNAKEHECAVAVKAGQILSHDLDRQNKLVPALANGQLWRTAGIATHDCNAGGVVTVAYDGQVIFEDAPFEAGFIYVASPTEAGQLIPVDTLGDTGYLAIVGYAVSDKVLELIHLQRRAVALREPKPLTSEPPKAVKGK